MHEKDLELEKIDIYGGTQARVATNDEAVSSYSQSMTEGSTFPSIIVYFDGSKHWLADGFHRFLAAQRSGLATLKAEIHEGARTDALKHALGANSTNGIYRSNADKRNAVEIALDEWPNMSNSVIAGMCHVSDDLVRRCRIEMEKLSRIEPQSKVIGKDGKEYPVGIEREPRGKTEKSSSDEGSGEGGGTRGKGKAEFGAPGGSNAEIEADAKKMIRNGEIKHSELDKLASANAIDYAETAINVLDRMKLEDPRRKDAIRRIQNWLTKQVNDSSNPVISD